MSIVRLVRHGEAAASYNEHPDPGLSDRGRVQAEAVATALAELAPDTASDTTAEIAVVSSPMARARETAEPLARAWQAKVRIESGVSEIPSPGLGPAERGPWLQGVMAGTWDEAGPEIRHWRDGIAAALLACDTDAVVFSHYVAINAAISVAIRSDELHCRSLDHCSVTTFDTDGGELRLVEAGDEGVTTVL